jgi:hypothetical protein
MEDRHPQREESKYQQNVHWLPDTISAILRIMTYIIKSCLLQRIFFHLACLPFSLALFLYFILDKYMQANE